MCQREFNEIDGLIATNAFTFLTKLKELCAHFLLRRQVDACFHGLCLVQNDLITVSNYDSSNLKEFQPYKYDTLLHHAYKVNLFGFACV